ncbi:hypothetical protein DFO66_10442 [Brevibacterium sanguinis]|uniref:N-acetyltransferase domain-containing protein n=2 Tax=Brevibacterium TaxID=1696 RepID=A0A366ILM1_9MICO|nr:MULTISPECIES: hypothetical protein [Brevibacterium]RBP65459.1 hypothetical protein DFO66_10442 [Brevibacterium sanguinis]RBP72093.1 hypothetical protein DFO65_10448 [Brevibacterium celere]
MYTMLDNRGASKFDLYLPGKLVASLHYKVEKDRVLFHYLEAIEPEDADQHCAELVSLAMKDVANRRLPVVTTCPIAARYLPPPEETAASVVVVEKPQARDPRSLDPN